MSKAHKRDDGKFHSKHIKHDPNAESARAVFGLKSPDKKESASDVSDTPKMSSRGLLAKQVREEYANIRHSKKQQHFHETTTGITPEAYYGTLENMVISEIDNGRFDNCRSGKEIVNKVAADKTLLPDWN